MTIRKGDTYTNEHPLTVGSQEIPAHTVFCVDKGGQNPSLTYLDPNDPERLRCIKGPASAITKNLTPTTPDKLPKLLQLEFGVGDAVKALSSFRKGDIVRLEQTFDFSNGPTLEKGTLAKCQRGGQSPNFTAYRGNCEFLDFTLPPAEILKLKPVPPVEDHPVLARIKHRIKTFKELSEETIALDGTLELDGHKVHVSNRGHGDPLLIHSLTDGATQAIGDALAGVLKEAGLETFSHQGVLEDFVDHLTTGAHGLVTFTDHLTDNRNALGLRT